MGCVASHPKRSGAKSPRRKKADSFGEWDVVKPTGKATATAVAETETATGTGKARGLGVTPLEVSEAEISRSRHAISQLVKEHEAMGRRESDEDEDSIDEPRFGSGSGRKSSRKRKKQLPEAEKKPLGSGNNDNEDGNGGEEEDNMMDTGGDQAREEGQENAPRRPEQAQEEQQEQQGQGAAAATGNGPQKRLVEAAGLVLRVEPATYMSMSGLSYDESTASQISPSSSANNTTLGGDATPAAPGTPLTPVPLTRHASEGAAVAAGSTPSRLSLGGSAGRARSETPSSPSVSHEEEKRALERMALQLIQNRTFGTASSADDYFTPAERAQIERPRPKPRRRWKRRDTALEERKAGQREQQKEEQEEEAGPAKHREEGAASTEDEAGKEQQPASAAAAAAATEKEEGAQEREPEEGDEQAQAQEEEEEEEEEEEDVEWMRGELLGAGAFGSVYMALDANTGQMMAVKQVPLDTSSPTAEKRLRALERELAVLRELDDPHIVRYLGTQRDTEASTLNVFMEYVPGGSLSSLLKRFGSFKETLVKKYTRQILLGLEYLHKHQVVHRDIKGANILVDVGGVCKVADFGASARIADLAQEKPRITGTPFWMAPEVVRQTGHGRKVDIWSLGCTTLELLTGRPPWSDLGSHAAVLFRIASTTSPPEVPKNLSEDGRDFILRCLERDPKKRPTAHALLQHPWVASGRRKVVPTPLATPLFSHPSTEDLHSGETLRKRDTEVQATSSPAAPQQRRVRSCPSPAKTQPSAVLFPPPRVVKSPRADHVAKKSVESQEDEVMAFLRRQHQQLVGKMRGDWAKAMPRR